MRTIKLCFWKCQQKLKRRWTCQIMRTRERVQLLVFETKHVTIALLLQWYKVLSWFCWTLFRWLRGGPPPYIILCQVGFYGKVKRAIYLELAMKPTPNCYSCKITIVVGRLLSVVAVSYATLKVSVDFWCGGHVLSYEVKCSRWSLSVVCFLLFILFKPFLCLWLPHSLFLMIDALAQFSQTPDAVQLILLDISHLMAYLELIFQHVDLRLDLRIEHGNCDTAHLNFLICTALFLIPLSPPRRSKTRS